MKLLLVENNEAFSRAVSREFLTEYEIETATTVEKAISIFNSSVVEIALIDYDLDDGKGDEVVSYIREQGNSIKIVAISSHSQGNNNLLNAGADTVCPKMEFRNINIVLKRILS